MFENFWNHISPAVYRYLDISVLSTVVATFFGLLPEVTAFFALIYLLIRIWETDTIRELTNRVKPTK